ncbi:pirin family protein [Burkholderia vietnamiensis]|uniref:pirin family protein n=1 Tax=Burkholderia vietnamiensis TaxID=60552 RepID=UPI00159308F3|nr:pirin family protein [Burkholderia vietnamiensis]
MNMFEIRRAEDRGNANQGAVNSYFSFSFEDYYHNEKHVNFGALIALNEDFISPGQGFDLHSHDNIEIFTYMMQGELTQDDADGRHSVIVGGEVQRISAGSGVSHCGLNARGEPAHLLQIWLTPNVRDAKPRCDERRILDTEKDGRFCLLASGDGRDGSLPIHQDVSIFAGTFKVGQTATYEVKPGRMAYVHAARGSVTLNGQVLGHGDAAKVPAATTLVLNGGEKGEVVLIDLPEEHLAH